MSEFCGPRNGWTMKERNIQPVFCRDIPGRRYFLVSLPLCNTANVSKLVKNMFQHVFIICWMFHMPHNKWTPKSSCKINIHVLLQIWINWNKSLYAPLFTFSLVGKITNEAFCRKWINRHSDFLPSISSIFNMKM